MAAVVTFVKTARAGLARAGIARAGFAPPASPYLIDRGSNLRIYSHSFVAEPSPEPAVTTVEEP